MIRYEFTYKGKTCSSSNISLEKGPTLIHAKRNNTKGYFVGHLPTFVRNLKVNPKVNVWVNPLNTNQSTLIINQRSHSVYTVMGITLIIWSLGIGKLSLGPFINLNEKVIIIEKKSAEEIEKFEEDRMKPAEKASKK